MNEKSTKRREWVKTAAIIFLSIMLVLTFFSQTIMNYSLPIVAAQYVTSGSISAKVRGTGNIEAADPYSVELAQSRVISSVAVRKGDYVEKDQVLFYLEDAESEELKAAEQELENLLLEFQKSLLATDTSNSVISNAQNGTQNSMATYQSRISAAQSNYNAITAQIEELEKQKALLALNTTVDTTVEDNAVSDAQAKLAAAETKLANAESKLSEINGKITFATEEEAKSNADSLETVANAYLLPMQEAEAEMNAISQVVNALIAVRDAKIAYDVDQSDANKQALQAAIDALKAVDAAYEYTVDGTDLEAIQAALTNANGKYTAAAETFTETREEYNVAYANYQAALEQYQLFSQKKKAQSAVNSAKKEVEGAKQALASAIHARDSKVANGNTSAAQTEVERKLLEATAAQEKAKQELDNILKELEFGAQNSEIAKKREEVEKLRAESIGAEVKAPIAGTVTELNYVAGQPTNNEQPLAVIQPDGKGFSLSFSVTADQAKRLTPGDPADVQNSWYYSDITATLAQIKNDPQNPGRNKILVFNIEGDVMDGQSLSLSIGQKSANYDMIVPNSAIREDNNGKFILTVESKSSPLGNRYIATRVDVEVLASDDTQSAISGALYGYEFVITTSNKPVEAGKQVRLADN